MEYILAVLYILQQQNQQRKCKHYSCSLFTYRQTHEMMLTHPYISTLTYVIYII